MLRGPSTREHRDAPHDGASPGAAPGRHRAATGSAPPSLADRAAEAATAMPHRILLVEDSDDDALLVQSELAKTGRRFAFRRVAIARATRSRSVSLPTREDGIGSSAGSASAATAASRKGSGMPHSSSRYNPSSR